MAAHRAQLLLTFLPNAMSTGFTEIEPELEQLKVIKVLSICRYNS
jgi:hypothetical protein